MTGMPANKPVPVVRSQAPRCRAAGTAFVVALALSACGGGVYWGWGGDDSPPAVSITTAATSVVAGQGVRFVAAASDENGIDHVAFYRVDAGGALLLGIDAAVPYEWFVTAPSDGRTSLSVFARATDNNGNRADSDTVTILVIP